MWAARPPHTWTCVTVYVSGDALPFACICWERVWNIPEPRECAPACVKGTHSNTTVVTLSASFELAAEALSAAVPPVVTSTSLRPPPQSALSGPSRRSRVSRTLDVIKTTSRWTRQPGSRLPQSGPSPHLPSPFFLSLSCLGRQQKAFLMESFTNLAHTQV